MEISTILVPGMAPQLNRLDSYDGNIDYNRILKRTEDSDISDFKFDELSPPIYPPSMQHAQSTPNTDSFGDPQLIKFSSVSSNPGNDPTTLRSAPYMKIKGLTKTELEISEAYMQAKEQNREEGILYDDFSWPVQSPRRESMNVQSSMQRKQSIHEAQQNFQRIIVTNIGASPTVSGQGEMQRAVDIILDCLDLRDKYIVYDEGFRPPPLIDDNKMRWLDVFEILEDDELSVEMEDGVFNIYRNNEKLDDGVMNVREYYRDLAFLLQSVTEAAPKTFAHQRLKIIDQKFKMHTMYNTEREMHEQQLVPHRDFYNLRKIDNHVHHSACMNAKHFLNFMKRKVKTEPDVIVLNESGQDLTLAKVFKRLKVQPHELSIDSLDVSADFCFQRFDRFNQKYNPFGQPYLRDIFLKSDNRIEGRYLAEITHEVIENLEREKYQLAEYRISIYGKSREEWNKLAHWFKQYNIKSPNVVWLIQIPRLYHVYKKLGIVYSFGELLNNIFLPIFNASIEPEKHPEINEFLQQVVGFDTVDDESIREKVTSYHNYKEITPEKWRATDNPPYSYYSYYIYANLTVLNRIRKSKGLNTLAFRPHCGEAGVSDHLAVSFLTAHSINHGIELRKNPVLQYLYYLRQVGMSLSPLSNNKLFLQYAKNPFRKYFQRGLNVTLSTDDPLMIHLTKEPLLEEYSVAAQLWNLNRVDLCELVRNSVIQSGFSHEQKQAWIGQNYYENLPRSNDIEKTNLPSIRYMFRSETYNDEIQLLNISGSRQS